MGALLERFDENAGHLGLHVSWVIRILYVGYLFTPMFTPSNIRRSYNSGLDERSSGLGERDVLFTLAQRA